MQNVKVIDRFSSNSPPETELCQIRSDMIPFMIIPCLTGHPFMSHWKIREPVED